MKDKIRIVLLHSQELIQKHPANEVIWIWRRICSQIYIESIEDTDIVDIFVQNEINIFLTTYDDESDQQRSSNDTTTMILHDKYYQQKSILYRKTYILWLLEHFQRQKCNILRQELMDLQSTLIRSLGLQEEIDDGTVIPFSNLWQIKSNSAVSTT